MSTGASVRLHLAMVKLASLPTGQLTIVHASVDAHYRKALRSGDFVISISLGTRVDVNARPLIKLHIGRSTTWSQSIRLNSKALRNCSKDDVTRLSCTSRITKLLSPRDRSSYLAACNAQLHILLIKFNPRKHSIIGSCRIHAEAANVQIQSSLCSAICTCNGLVELF